MVSRRNFVAITMIMAIVLFLFQGLNMAKEKLNHYETNTYVKMRRSFQTAVKHLERRMTREKSM